MNEPTNIGRGGPTVVGIITRSRHYPGLLSIHTPPNLREPHGGSILRALSEADFQEGDEVVIRLVRRPKAQIEKVAGMARGNALGPVGDRTEEREA